MDFTPDNMVSSTMALIGGNFYLIELVLTGLLLMLMLKLFYAPIMGGMRKLFK